MIKYRVVAYRPDRNNFGPIFEWRNDAWLPADNLNNSSFSSESEAIDAIRNNTKSFPPDEEIAIIPVFVPGQ